MSGVNRLPGLWGQINDFGREMDRVLERWAVDASRQLGINQSFPPVNVWEEDQAFHVEAELPGLTQDQLSIVVSQRNQVTIGGEWKVSEHEGNWHRRERLAGKFERVLTFPAPLDADKVEARLEQGVLHLTLPKAEEAKPRKITVTAK